MTKRQFFFDSPQGIDEIVNTYTFDASKWGFMSLTAITSVTATDKNGTDASADIISGSGSISGTTITLPIIQSLDITKRPYRIELKFTSGSGTYEAFGFLDVEL